MLRASTSTAMISSTTRSPRTVATAAMLGTTGVSSGVPGTRCRCSAMAAMRRVRPNTASSSAPNQNTGNTPTTRSSSSRTTATDSDQPTSLNCSLRTPGRRHTISMTSTSCTSDIA
jgi:hypothetical protein